MSTTSDLLKIYRTLPDEQRREIARHASPELRAQLLTVEREMAMDRSPGALAAILTNGKERQARHLDLVDHAFQRIAAGDRVKVMLTMPPRHGKSRRASRWAPVWYLRRNPDHRLMLASYSATLADDHGRWIRDTITGYSDVLGIALNQGSRAANRVPKRTKSSPTGCGALAGSSISSKRSTSCTPSRSIWLAAR